MEAEEVELHLGHVGRQGPPELGLPEVGAHWEIVERLDSTDREARDVHIAHVRQRREEALAEAVGCNAGCNTGARELALGQHLAVQVEARAATFGEGVRCVERRPGREARAHHHRRCRRQRHRVHQVGIAASLPHGLDGARER